MAGGNLFRIFGFAREEIDFLLGAAVHGVVELELPHAKVIFRAQFSEDFFDLRCLGIASGLCEFDNRLLIVERFHRILFESQILGLVRVGQFDTESRCPIHRDAAHDGSLAVGLQRHALAVREDDSAAGQCLAAGDRHFNFRALQRRNIGAVLFFLYRQSRVEGIMIRIIDLLDAREIGDVNGEFL